MMLIRASIGFLTFHLLFWLREDYGLAPVRPRRRRQRGGLDDRQRARPILRRSLREERMLVGALA